MDLNITYTSSPPNFTGDPSLEEWKQKPHVRYLLIIGYGTVILLNVIGNPLVCLVVAMNKNMRNVTNLFIANVAVSDFLVGAICMPLTLVNNLKAGWVFGRVMCTVLPMIMGMTVTASVLTLVAIAVDRYLAVMRPTDDKISNKVTCIVIAGIWTAASAIMIPAGVRLYNRTVRRQPSPNDARNDRGSNVQKLGNKVRVFKMMVAVVVLFACLHLPMWIANLINDIAPPEKTGKGGFRRAFMPRRAPRELDAPKVTYKRAAVADQQDRVEVQCRLGQESPMDSRLLRPLPSPVTLEAVNHDSRPVTPPATLEVANHDCSPGDPNYLQDDNH
ncbi:Neuropeptide FF receptor 2 [Branchiostoma belcheri]|nr:Neuropeptide FF receptor 2 [Branchiostoma belcheri]